MPLGLYENISHISFKEVEFGYVSDFQSLGKGTTKRKDYTFNRICGFKGFVNCSEQNHGFNVFSNATVFDRQGDDDVTYISFVIPLNITNIFSSDSKGAKNLIAGAFDIHFDHFLTRRTFG